MLLVLAQRGQGWGLQDVLTCLESQTLCYLLFVSAVLFSLCLPHPRFTCLSLLEDLYASCHKWIPATQMCSLASSFWHLPWAATRPGPPTLIKSCRWSIWRLLIWHGASGPRHTPTWVLLWNKGSCREGNPSYLWPMALQLTLAPKLKMCTAEQEHSDVRIFSSIYHTLEKSGRGVLYPPFLSDYPSPWSLLKNHLLYVKVIDDPKIASAWLSHPSTPTDIIFSLGGQMNTQKYIPSTISNCF